MVNFLLTSDINEQSLKKATGVINFSETLQLEYLDEVNEWYTEQSLELGVDEDDIKVYNPNIDDKDERNRAMVKLCLYKYYKEVFFYEWGKNEDIFNLKYPIVEKEFNNMLVKMNYNRIIGEKPAVVKSTLSFTSFDIHRGS